MWIKIAVCVGMLAAGLAGWVADRRLRDRNWGACPLRKNRVCGCGIRSTKFRQMCCGADPRLPRNIGPAGIRGRELLPSLRIAGGTRRGS